MKTHVATGTCAETRHALTRLRRAGLHAVDNFTFPIALKACAALRALKQGQQIHALVLLLGFRWNVYAGNALITMYCCCGNIQAAAQVFDHMPQRNTVTWNSIMTGCIHNGLAHESFSYFRRMITAQSLFSSSPEQWPDSVTMCTILNAHAHLGPVALRSGCAVHGYITRQGHRIVTKPETKRPFVKNALIHMYIESLCLTYAEKIFQGMVAEERDVVTWTTMISGYLNYKMENQALATFRSMLCEHQGNAGLDAVTLATVIPALRSLRQGRELHCFAIKNGHDKHNVFVISSLLHMYAEYGAIECATKIFQRLEQSNVVVWTAMIMGYAKHGRSEDCLRLFDEMRLQAGVMPNQLTFMGVLTACSHAGLVDKAQEYFKCMTQEYGLMPDLHHYAAMVDVLGRAGRLREALNFIEAMPMKPSSPVWGSLLAFCGLHQDVDLGKEVAKIVLGIEPDNPGNFVLLSNMLAQDQKWDDASMVREAMKCLRLRKVPGCSLVHGPNRTFSWKLADKVAATGFLVVVPDFFYGDPFDMQKKFSRLDKGVEDSKPVISALKSKGVSAVGAAGFCWGGKVVGELAKSNELHAAVLLHPSRVTVDDIREVKPPIAILGAEIDRASPPELLKKFEEALSSKPEVSCFVKVYPGVEHGWTVRYDIGDELAVKIAEEAHEDMLNWFIKHLK